MRRRILELVFTALIGFTAFAAYASASGSYEYMGRLGPFESEDKESSLSINRIVKKVKLIGVEEDVSLSKCTFKYRDHFPENKLPGRAWKEGSIHGEKVITLTFGPRVVTKMTCEGSVFSGKSSVKVYVNPE